MSLLKYYYTSIPQRLGRLPAFIFDRNTYRRAFWFAEWPLLLFDVLGVPELLQGIHRLFNWKQRKLNSREKLIAYSIFKDSIDWESIRMNSNALISKRFRLTFVSFHTINYSDKIRDDVFIHELAHIWQYEKFGSSYIVRSLHAQHTREGYDYGGLLALQSKEKLTDFNFEQMAEIIRDAYLRGDGDPIFNKYKRQLLE